MHGRHWDPVRRPLSDLVHGLLFGAHCYWRVAEPGSASGVAAGAPRTTTGLPSLYSRAAFTWAGVRSTTTRSDFSPDPKRKILQSTAILRLPTPRKPPKSITAART